MVRVWKVYILMDDLFRVNIIGIIIIISMSKIKEILVEEV